MDPLSITTGVVALVTCCCQVFQLISSLRGRQAGIQRTLDELSVAVSTYHVALSQIQVELNNQNSVVGKILRAENEWTKSFNAALSGSSITMSNLITELQHEVDSITNGWRFFLKEEDIKELMGDLRGQQQGFQILTSALHLKSTSEIFELLRENQAVLEELRCRTNSRSKAWKLRGPSSDHGEDDTFSVLGFDPDEKLSEVDGGLLSTLEPYLRAFSAQRRREREIQQTSANLMDDDNLIVLSTQSEYPGPHQKELHREFSFGLMMNPVAVHNESSQGSTTPRHSIDIEKHSSISSAPSRRVSKELSVYFIEDAFKAIEVSELVDFGSVKLSTDQSTKAVDAVDAGQKVTLPQSEGIREGSLDRRLVALLSMEPTKSSLPTFEVHECHLNLGPEFQDGYKNLQSSDCTEATFLQWASVHGDLNVVKAIVEQRGEAPGRVACQLQIRIGENLVSFDGWTPLSIASYFGHLPIVDYLSKKISSNAADHSQRSKRSGPKDLPLFSPLFAAVASVPYLILLNSLSRDSPSTSNISHNDDLLSISNLRNIRIQQSDLWRYPNQPSNSDQESRLEIVKILSNAHHQAFGLDIQDRQGFNLVQAAACGTSLSALRLALQLRRKKNVLTKIGSKLKINSDSSPDTPLHLAAFWNRTKSVELLLHQKGTSPDVLGYRGRTPLHYAAAMGNPAIIELLHSANATIDIADSEGNRPIDLAFRWGQWSAMVALIKAKSDLVRFDSYNRNHRVVTETILHTAVRVFNSNRIRAVVTLLENGASVNFPNNRRQTPLHFAISASGPRSELIDCLIKHGADPKRRDVEGNSPLHLAIIQGSNDGTAHLIVKALLDANADPLMKNHAGKDAFALTRDCIASATKSTSLKVAEDYLIDDYLEIIKVIDGKIPGAARRQSSFHTSKLG